MSKRTIAVVATALILGIGAGYVFGTRAERKHSATVEDEAVATISLVRSGKDAVVFAKLLEALRAGERELVLDRLETHLDLALIDIDHYYSPHRDLYGTVSSALPIAKQYRANNPHRSRINAAEVDAALALSPK